MLWQVLGTVGGLSSDIGGIGNGDSDLFAKAAGCNYYAETSIGEFAIGSRREEDVV